MTATASGRTMDGVRAHTLGTMDARRGGVLVPSFLSEVGNSPSRRVLVLDIGANRGLWGRSLVKRCHVVSPSAHVEHIMFAFAIKIDRSAALLRLIISLAG